MTYSISDLRQHVERTSGLKRSANQVAKALAHWYPQPARRNGYTQKDLRAAEFIFRSQALVGGEDNQELRRSMFLLVMTTEGPGWVVAYDGKAEWVRTPEMAALVTTVAKVGVAIPIEM